MIKNIHILKIAVIATLVAQTLGFAQAAGENTRAKIRQLDTSYCLDVPGHDFASEKNLIFWTCKTLPLFAVDNQTFFVNVSSATARTRFVTARGNKCLTIKWNEPRPGQEVFLFECNSSDPDNQVFYKHGHLIKSAAGDNLCLDNHNVHLNNSAKLYVETCNENTPGQKLVE